MDPSTREQQLVPASRFPSGKDTERYFLALGADAEVIERTSETLKKTGTAVLAIL
jgi:hypothetical protein